MDEPGERGRWEGSETVGEVETRNKERIKSVEQQSPHRKHLGVKELEGRGWGWGWGWGWLSYRVWSKVV